MPLTTPISGQHLKVTYGTGPTTLAATNWKANPKGNPIDVSNGVDGRRRIAGLGDADGSFDVHVDTAATTEADLAAGTLVTLNLYTDAAKRYPAIAAIIDSVDISNEVEGTYDASIKWSLASGTFPSAPS
jgi:SH3-like domain-containing protein